MITVKVLQCKCGEYNSYFIDSGSFIQNCVYCGNSLKGDVL